jgi:hypothetical protein
MHPSDDHPGEHQEEKLRDWGIMVAEKRGLA